MEVQHSRLPKQHQLELTDLALSSTTRPLHTCSLCHPDSVRREQKHPLDKNIKRKGRLTKSNKKWRKKKGRWGQERSHKDTLKAGLPCSLQVLQQTPTPARLPRLSIVTSPTTTGFAPS
ncbi:hypothetical protein E2C01_000807 [Portunus trituberculatus]|uniref:Uncharacterized protein n=1 Tax=Portunus trituberculatus TaxID=210409 RepID=A0A5B7CHK6_PORTR|nr:hypothetical protein [Portunus trituberculatus]